MDIEQALEWLSLFERRTVRRPQGVVRECHGSQKLKFEIHFRAKHYHILATIVVGPRSGISEEVLIVDTRRKSVEADQLLTAYKDAPTLGSICLFADKIGKVSRKDMKHLTEKIKQVLLEEVASAKNDPEKYASEIDHLVSMRNVTEPSSSLRCLEGGMPRT